ncbi:MAG: fimbrillin family protein [Candidatus Cryptobacteroides sp.]
MKKIVFVFAALAVFVSCQKDNAVKDGNHTYSFNAAQEKVSTRTVIDGNTSKWSGSEQVRVLGKDGANYLFNADVATPSEQAVFTYSGTDEVVGFGEDGKSFYAVYPSGSANLTADTQTHTVSGINVPTTQNAVEGSYDVMAPVAIAYCTDGKTLAFKNVTALVKFQVLVEGVTKVTFSGNNSEPVSGDITVSYNDGQPTFASTETTQTYVELICDEGFAIGKDYYFSILPNTFTKGFKIELNGTRERYLQSEKTIGRSSVLTDITLGTDVPSVMCDASFWAKSRGAMVLENDYYVKKGVALTSSGFKIHNGFTWFTTIESAIQTNCWYNIYWSPSLNSTPAVEEGATYDIYVDKKCKSVCVVKNGETMTEKSSANTQLYIVLQQNWDWGNRRLHYWYKDDKGITTWPGDSPTSEGLYFQNDGSKKNCYWKMPKETVNGHNIGIIFSNCGDSQTSDYFLESFDNDYYFYLDSNGSKNYPVAISL